MARAVAWRDTRPRIPRASSPYCSASGIQNARLPRGCRPRRSASVVEMRAQAREGGRSAADQNARRGGAHALPRSAVASLFEPPRLLRTTARHAGFMPSTPPCSRVAPPVPRRPSSGLFRAASAPAGAARRAANIHASLARFAVAFAARAPYAPPGNACVETTSRVLSPCFTFHQDCFVLFPHFGLPITMVVAFIEKLSRLPYRIAYQCYRPLFYFAPPPGQHFPRNDQSGTWRRGCMRVRSAASRVEEMSARMGSAKQR